MPTPSTNGYGRTATVVIAAYNASAASLASADAICSGTDDMAVIQGIISKTLAAQVTDYGAPFGLRVVLTEGTFVRSAPLYLDQNCISIEGQGDSTVITSANLGADSNTNNPTGSAHIIIGSNTLDGTVRSGTLPTLTNGLYSGDTWGSDAFPTTQPNE